MENAAFQDLMPDNHCFGCGPHNAKGLQIKSFWDGDDTVCTFQPGSMHAAGPKQYLNGGIAATLIDCHSVCSATAWAYRSEARVIGSEPTIWFVTGSLEVQYIAPVPIEAPVHLRARIVEVDGRKTRLECSLSSGTGGTGACAHAKVLAVRVSPAWRDGLCKGGTDEEF